MALVLFDLNGTLLDPGDGAGPLQGAVRLAMIHSLGDDFRPFAELLEAAGGAVPDEMPPFGDVPAGLDALREAGHRLVVVTNSARATAERHLERAGLRDRFDGVIGVDEIGVYKPSRRVYEEALRRLEAEPGETWFVAAHDWDVAGAHLAGLRTVFVARGGPEPVTVRADRTVTGLTELRL